MARVECLCLSGLRRELLQQTAGKVLEIGAGTGANLEHYPEALAGLVLCDPDRAMRRELSQRAAVSRTFPRYILAARSETLPFASHSFDCVVATLVLCSVTSPLESLREIRRVLKPGGQLFLMEHVAARRGTALFLGQRLLTPLWSRIACHCHLDRNTLESLREAGFEPRVRHGRMKGAPVFVQPMIVGRAFPRKEDFADERPTDGSA